MVRGYVVFNVCINLKLPSLGGLAIKLRVIHVAFSVYITPGVSTQGIEVRR